MTGAARIAAFAAVLALVFAGAAAAGGAIGPEGDDDTPAAHDADSPVAAGQDHSEMASTSAPTAAAGAAHPVRGLAVAENGLRLVVDEPELRRGARERLGFRVVDEDGETVRDFDVEHAKRLHLIVARRDLTGFQHLHPTQGADGSWTTQGTLRDAGSYRLFADFTHKDTATTLASDLRVDGSADLEPLPAPATAATSDGGYDVRLDAGRARPGHPAQLRFTVTRDGEPVHVEPYLGADGHLVALREGDLAFLHVHPTGHAGEDDHGAGHEDAIGFDATFPTAGRYRLFLQFKHQGDVQTVAFTQEVE